MKQLKLYSTIDCQINGNSIPSIESKVYKEIILDTLDKFDTGSIEKGLMDYIYNETLNSKISFAKASVEVIGKELFGVLICDLKSPISDNEIQLLEDECKGLYGDGWGEGFEQVDISIPKSKDILNVSFFFQFGNFFYKRIKYVEIENKNEAVEFLNTSNIIENIAFQNIDFIQLETLVLEKTFTNCIFLGCTIPKTILAKINENCHIYSTTSLPFNLFVSSLYKKETLLDGYNLGNPLSYEDTLDKKVYNHYIINGKEAESINETLFRRLHDHSITNAMNNFLEAYKEKKIVAVMGGHSLLRNNSDYIEVAKISKKLTELGYLTISGGGPGAMEATHLGAWLAGKSENDLVDSVNILSQAPSYKNRLWLDKSYEVLELFPSSKYESLGIPTWLYGHEPPTPFASKIAKYFANSVREDGLLAIAKGGVIFAPGSAGTIQEIFQDATQNHYLSFGYASPMVFLNKEYWTVQRPILPLLEKMISENKYKNILLSSHNQSEEIVSELEKFGQ